MSSFKHQLKKALENDGWELIGIVEENLDWWCDEYWVIRSVRENWGLELLILFLVDPQWNLLPKKGEGIDEIVATEKFPAGWGEARSGIALPSMDHRIFQKNLAGFITSLNEHRRK